jgi:hypothetical protein
MILLRPVCDLLLVNSQSNYSGTVFGLNDRLQLKEHEILRKIMYYLKCDTIGLTSFCFLGLKCEGHGEEFFKCTGVWL